MNSKKVSLANRFITHEHDKILLRYALMNLVKLDSVHYGWQRSPLFTQQVACLTLFSPHHDKSERLRCIFVLSTI